MPEEKNQTTEFVAEIPYDRSEEDYILISSQIWNRWVGLAGEIDKFTNKLTQEIDKIKEKNDKRTSK